MENVYQSFIRETIRFVNPFVGKSNKKTEFIENDGAVLRIWYASSAWSSEFVAFTCGSSTSTAPRASGSCLPLEVEVSFLCCTSSGDDSGVSLALVVDDCQILFEMMCL